MHSLDGKWNCDDNLDYEFIQPQNQNEVFVLGRDSSVEIKNIGHGKIIGDYLVITWINLTQSGNPAIHSVVSKISDDEKEITEKVQLQGRHFSYGTWTRI